MNPRHEKTAKALINLISKAVWTHVIACGYEYALVAEGKLDGRVCLDGFGGDYDYAPVSLLVSEAGGVVKNIGKDTYDYRNHDFLATNPRVYEELSNDPELMKLFEESLKERQNP